MYIFFILKLAWNDGVNVVFMLNDPIEDTS